MADALRIMVEANEIASKMGVDTSAKWAKLQGNLYSRLVMHVHAKKSAHRKEYRSLKEIAAEHFDIFVQEFTNVPNIKDLVCPWVYIPLAQNRSKAPKPQETNEMKGAVRELDCKGNVTAENLVEMGFVANTRVKSKDTGKLYDIVDVSADGLMLTLSDGTTIQGTAIMGWETVVVEKKD